MLLLQGVNPPKSAENKAAGIGSTARIFGLARGLRYRATRGAVQWPSLVVSAASLGSAPLASEDVLDRLVWGFSCQGLLLCRSRP
jgi:hypothetical protein